MSIGILGVKLGMTQIFDESGLAIPVTVIKAGPCIITQLKTNDKEGYEAIQIGYSQVPQNKLSKPQLGHLEKSDLPPLKYLKEYTVDSIESYSLNQKITVDSFEVASEILLAEQRNARVELLSCGFLLGHAKSLESSGLPATNNIIMQVQNILRLKFEQ